MKLLQINASYKPAYIYGGPIMSVSKLSEQLIKAGVELEVFTTTANGSTELPVALNTPINVDHVKVTYFKRITKDHSHFSPSLLANVWKRAKQFDVIHIHAWWNLVSVLSALISVFKGVKVVVSPRGTLSAFSFGHKNSFLKSVLHTLIGKPVLSRCYIHATSSREYMALSKTLIPKYFFDIANFVQLRAHKVIDKKAVTGPLKLLFLSRIDQKKGLDILLRALPGLNFPYHLTIVGDAEPTYLDHLKSIAQQNSTANNITWLGFQHINKFELFEGHHIFVLPSHDENFGNVVIESLSAGTPVIISKNVGLADYVTKNELGWVFDLDVISLTAAINKAAAQPQQLMEISKIAPQQVRADFDDDKLTEQYIAMYNHILNHG